MRYILFVKKRREGDKSISLLRFAADTARREQMDQMEAKNKMKIFFISGCVVR